ncbi:hypothetical protein MRX96_003984 [Rhipicephalus microplus]
MSLFMTTMMKTRKVDVANEDPVSPANNGSLSPRENGSERPIKRERPPSRSGSSSSRSTPVSSKSTKDGLGDKSPTPQSHPCPVPLPNQLPLVPTRTLWLEHHMHWLQLIWQLLTLQPFLSCTAQRSVPTRDLCCPYRRLQALMRIPRCGHHLILAPFLEENHEPASLDRLSG